MAETLIATADTHGIITIQDDTDNILGAVAAGGPVHTLAMGIQENKPHLIATTMPDQEMLSTIQAWDLTTNQPLFTTKQGVVGSIGVDNSRVASAALVNRGSYLYALSQETENGRLAFRQLTAGSGEYSDSLSVPSRIWRDQARACSLAVTPEAIYMGSDKGTIYTWRMAGVYEHSIPGQIFLPSHRYSARHNFAAVLLARTTEGTLFAGDMGGGLHVIENDQLTRSMYANDRNQSFAAIATGQTERGDSVLATVRRSGTDGQTSLLSVLRADAVTLADTLLEIPSIRPTITEGPVVDSCNVAIADLQGERCVLSGASDGNIYAWRLPQEREKKRPADIVFQTGRNHTIKAIATLSLTSPAHGAQQQ